MGGVSPQSAKTRTEGSIPPVRYCERSTMYAHDRTAYQTESILAEGRTIINDSWQSHLNCNQLVLGPSGSGKTRNFLKPNLLQANASYLVLDTKGKLYHEIGPILAELGYDVQSIDFTDVCGTVGYDPLDYIDRDLITGEPSQRDIISVASALCPAEDLTQPFWDHAAANYLASYIAYVLEVFPRELHTMDRVIDLYEQASDADELRQIFGSLAQTHPRSFSLGIYRRASSGMAAEKMHSSIMGVLAEKMMCLSFKEARSLYHAPKKVDFARMGHQRVALFVTVSDVDHSLRPLTDLFVTQALTELIREADKCEGGMLPQPVRLMLDDFSNLRIPFFDDVISVIRSREIWCTILCQSVSQLNQRYGAAGAETIMGNCDAQLVLAFADNTTTQAYTTLARRAPDRLRATPFDNAWLFVRGHAAEQVRKFDVTTHPRWRG